MEAILITPKRVRAQNIDKRVSSGRSYWIIYHSIEAIKFGIYSKGTKNYYFNILRPMRQWKNNFMYNDCINKLRDIFNETYYHLKIEYMQYM